MDHRFYRRLRPIAIVVLFFFTFFCIDPWNYAIWAQTSGNLGAQGLMPSQGKQKAKSSSQKFEKSLREAQKALDQIDHELKNNKDITHRIESLKNHRQALEQADKDILADFARTEAKLRTAKLPQTILKRQKEAVTRYKATYEKFLEDIDELDRLEKKRKASLRDQDQKRTREIQKELKEKVKSIHKKLEETKPKSRHLSPEKDTLPNRMREIKKPKTFKLSILKPVSDFLFPKAYAAEPPPAPEELAETIEVQFTQEIQDLAAQLDNNAVKIYEFVRNGLEFEAYRGSMKGAAQTLRERAGNDIDLASLLIALYRVSGIGARYVQGTIEIPMDRAKAWVGIDDPQMVGTLFMSQGIPATLVYEGAQAKILRIEHVWVEAYVPFLNGRGATNDSGDTWVQMDPSFKTHSINQSLNLTGVPFFDQEAYLSTFRTESPLEFYEASLQTFLDVEAPGYVPRGLARNLEIDFEFLGILTGQPPYNVKSVDATFAEVPDNLRQTFTLTIEDSFAGGTELIYTIPTASVIGKRLTLSYAAATLADEQTISAYGSLYDTPSYLINLIPQIKLEGEVVAEGNPIGAGEDQLMRFTFDDGFFTEQVENVIIAGEHYAIALDGQNVTRAEAFERSQRLAQINDTIDLADPTTLDDRLGELLYLSALTFHQNLDAAIRTIGPLHEVVDVRDVAEMMYFLTVQVDTAFGVPTTLTPVGITGDLDRDTHLVVPVDGDLSRVKPFFILEGTQSSFLEHKVTEGIYDTEVISAVKALQLANDQAIPVHNITSQNIGTVLPLLQLSPELEAEIQNAANAGMEITVPEQNLVVQDWQGVGYIIKDSATGAGAYRITGGLNGVGTVRAGLLVDLLATALSLFASNAYAAEHVPVVCFPGTDNAFHTGEGEARDVCYKIWLENEVTDVGPCLPGDNRCKNRYRANHGFAMPLIQITEHDPNVKITTHFTPQLWRSSDTELPQQSEFMRAGSAPMLITEVTMQFFKAQSVALGSGYRSYEHNKNVSQTNADAVENSYHVDGIAVDFFLFDFVLGPGEAPPKKCHILREADLLVGGNGEVHDEQASGPKNTVHIAIPTGGDRSRDYGSSGWNDC